MARGDCDKMCKQYYMSPVIMLRQYEPEVAAEVLREFPEDIRSNLEAVDITKSEEIRKELKDKLRACDNIDKHKSS
jgi:hypothetical protein